MPIHKLENYPGLNNEYITIKVGSRLVVVNVSWAVARGAKSETDK